jgi:hypothetical protein
VNESITRITKATVKIRNTQLFCYCQFLYGQSCKKYERTPPLFLTLNNDMIYTGYIINKTSYSHIIHSHSHYVAVITTYIMRYFEIFIFSRISECVPLLLHLIAHNGTHSVGILWMRDRPVAQHTTVKRDKTSMSPAEFEPAIPAYEQPYTYVSDRAPQGSVLLNCVGKKCLYPYRESVFGTRIDLKSYVFFDICIALLTCAIHYLMAVVKWLTPL